MQWKMEHIKMHWTSLVAQFCSASDLCYFMFRQVQIMRDKMSNSISSSNSESDSSSLDSEECNLTSVLLPWSCG
jgi:hypothetical protein